MRGVAGGDCNVADIVLADRVRGAGTSVSEDTGMNSMIGKADSNVKARKVK